MKDPLLTVLGPGQMGCQDVMFLFLLSDYGWQIAEHTFWHTELSKFAKLMREVESNKIYIDR